MSDLVKRLRKASQGFDVCCAAADELERKDAAIAELKAELQGSLLQERAECDRADAAIAELVQMLKEANGCIHYSTEFKVGSPAYEQVSALLHNAISKYGHE